MMRRQVALTIAATLTAVLGVGELPGRACAYGGSAENHDWLSDHTEETSFIFQTVKQHRLVVFSKTYCPYCRGVKELFAESYPGEKPFYVELDKREDGRAIQDTLEKLYGSRTVPQVRQKQPENGGRGRARPFEFVCRFCKYFPILLLQGFVYSRNGI